MQAAETSIHRARRHADGETVTTPAYPPGPGWTVTARPSPVRAQTAGGLRCLPARRRRAPHVPRGRCSDRHGHHRVAALLVVRRCGRVPDVPGPAPRPRPLAARHPSMPRSERRFSTGLPESVSVTRAGTGCMSVPASSVPLTHLLADRIMNRISAKATAGVLPIVPKLAPSVSPPAWRVLLSWLCTNSGGQ